MEQYFGNPNFCHSAVVNMAASPASEFKISDYLILEDVADYHHEECWSLSTETESSEKANSSDASHGFGDATSTTTTTTNNNNNNNIKCKNKGIKQKKAEVSQSITFRTRSQLEIMDDGYKWRKYGKKTVKNNFNPRNYYKCSGAGCSVKKRVERDRNDSNYVLTTYVGVHNHHTPSSYYTQMPLLHSDDWNLLPSATQNS